MREYKLLSDPNPDGDKFTKTREACQHGFEPNQLPHLIVIHTGENTPDFTPPDDGAEALARWATSRSCKVSWHATVDSDSIVWMLPDTYEAWHVRGYNDCGYGIEQSAKAADWVNTPWQWREATLRNCAKVVAEIALRNNIPLKWLTRAEVDAGERGVCSHAVLDPTRRSDPGPSYPYAWMLERAAEYQDDQVEPPAAGTAVMGPSVATVGQVKTVVKAKALPVSDFTAAVLDTIVDEYFLAGNLYGVRADLAVAMACKETGWFHFGGAVQPNQNNFAGIGATGGVPGVSFPTIRDGVRAQVLRMRMYAVNDADWYSDQVLVRPLPSRHWGQYPNIEDFNGVWAYPGTNYGQSIVGGYLDLFLKAPLVELGTVEERLVALERRVTALEGR